MWQLVLYTALVALSLAIYSERSRVVKRNGKRLPRPPGTLPLAGFGLWFLRPRYQLLDWFAEIQPKLGLDTYELAIPTLPPAVLINDPNNIEYVLKNHETFVKGDFFRSNSWDLFGNGILNADGDLWRIQRKAALRFFSSSNLKHFMDDVLPPLLKDLHGKLDAAAKADDIIDLQGELLELTTRLMGKIAYDMDIYPHMPFSKAFDYASAVTADRFTNPLWRLVEIFTGFKFKSCLHEVKSFGLKMVAAAQEKRSGADPVVVGPSEPLRKNLIDSLLDHISTPQTVADAAVNFLSAGRDTTAQSLTWTVYELLRHENFKPILLDAIQAGFPTQTRREVPHLPYDFVSSPHALPMVQAIFAETLRLNPAVPFELKETNEAITMPDGTFLPLGAVILWIPYGLARSTKIWGADASDFNPKRWLEIQPDGSQQVIMRSAFDNPVFNGGPRMCIGKRMAEILAIKVLTELWWCWDFQEIRGTGEVDGRRVTAESLTAPMEGGLPVRVRRPSGIGDRERSTVL